MPLLVQRQALIGCDWEPERVSEERPRWPDVMLIGSAAIPFVGMGVAKVQVDDESWAALIPFLLVAALAVVVLMSVYAARDRSFVSSEAPYWPRSRVGVWLYVAAMFSLPVMLVVSAIVSAASGYWLTGAFFLAMAITPTLLRILAIKEVRASR